MLFFYIWYSFVGRVENRHKISSFSAPIFVEGTPQIFDMRLQIWLTSQHVAKFG